MKKPEPKNIAPQKKLIVFQKKEVRRAWHNNEWYYSLVNVVGILTDSINPTDYLKKIRKRDEALGSYLGTNCPQVEMNTYTGKKKKNFCRKYQRYIPPDPIYSIKKSRAF